MISGRAKDREMLYAFIEDERLVATLLFLESNFPGYAIILDEATSQGTRLVIRARARGYPVESSSQIPVEIPFAIGCRIRKGKIFDHWFLAGQQEETAQFFSKINKYEKGHENRV